MRTASEINVSTFKLRVIGKHSAPSQLAILILDCVSQFTFFLGLLRVGILTWRCKNTHRVKTLQILPTYILLFTYMTLVQKNAKLNDRLKKIQ